MKSMNNHLIKKIEAEVALDKYGEKIGHLKVLKNELFDIVQNYFEVEWRDFLLNVFVLSNGKYQVNIEFISNNFVLKDGD